MRRIDKTLLVVAMIVCGCGNLRASGFYGPTALYLDEGGKNVDASPEFYWELEIERLARDFHPTEKLVLPKSEQRRIDEEAPNLRGKDTAAADVRDFADALKEGRIKPIDISKATQQHKAARDLIDSTSLPAASPAVQPPPWQSQVSKALDSKAGQLRELGVELPEEFASEFADYHRGAFAYRRGKNIGTRRARLGKICSNDRSKIDIIAAFGRPSCWASSR
jgi:hypothetical protein